MYKTESQIMNIGITQEEIREINLAFNEIQQKREAMLKLQEEQKLAEFKKLEWTKDCVALLDICPYGGVGLPTYTLKVGGPTPKFDCYFNSAVCVMGSDKNYQNNITYRSPNHFRGDFPTFETSNHDLMIEFLKTVKFKQLEFDKKHLAVLLAAKEVSEVK